MRRNFNWRQIRPRSHADDEFSPTRRRLVLTIACISACFVVIIIAIAIVTHQDQLEVRSPGFWLSLPWVLAAIFGALLAHCYIRTRQLRRWIGIENSTGLLGYISRLHGSGYHPSECMGRIDTYLDFMGHGASKWTHETILINNMLQRTYSNSGRVRFLLLDPNSEACLEASRVFRGRDDHARKITGSLMVLNELMTRYKHLEVRLYCHRPQFRLTFDDRESVTVGHYKGYRKGSDDSPILVCSRKASWSFYTAFLTHFEDEWERASEVDWDAIKESYANYHPRQSYQPPGTRDHT